MFAEMPLDNLTVNTFRGRRRQASAILELSLAFSPAACNVTMIETP
jgi:hypothetical protein